MDIICMKVIRAIKSLVFFCTLPLTITANADVTMIDKYGNNTQYSEEFIKQYENGNPAVIFSLTDGVVTTFNHASKEYMQMNSAELCKANETTTNIFSAFGRASHGKVNIEEKEGKLSIAGYLTVQYNVVQGDELKEVLWLSTDEKLLATLKKYDGKECNDSGSNHYSDSKPYQVLMTKGVVLKSYSGSEFYIEEALDSQNLDVALVAELEISEVVRVDFSDIPDAEFDISPDYKKISQGDMMNSSRKEWKAETVGYSNEKGDEKLIKSLNEEKTINKIKEMAEESEEGKVLFNALEKLFGTDEQD